MRVLFFNSLIVEVIHYAIVTFLFFSFAFGSGYYFVKLTCSVNFFLAFLIVVDLSAFFFYFTITGMIYCLYTTYMVNICRYLISGYFATEHPRLSKLMSSASSSASKEAQIATLLTAFSGHYIKLAELVQYIFRSFASKALFTFFLCNIAFNVYLFSILAFNSSQLSAVNRLLISAFLSIQITGPLLSIVPLAAISNSMHGSGGRLFLLMGQLVSSSSLLAKIRVMKVFEINCSDWRMACPIGPLGLVTNYSVFKVSK